MNGGVLRIAGMKGLGDNLYQRPFVRQAAQRWGAVYLETPWPELYADLKNVFPIRTGTQLRTQAKNERRTSIEFHRPPRGSQRMARFAYGSVELQRGSIISAFARQLPARGPLTFDLPANCRTPAATVLEELGPRYAVVRPATVRREWSNPARNPDPAYIAEAAAQLRAASIPVLVVADLAAGEEELVGPLPPHDLALLGGELSIEELLGTVAGAAAVAGGVGWLVPASIAAQRQALIILGGNGMHNAPEKITDPALDSSTLTFVTPDRFCLCERKDHACPKEISQFASRATTWICSLP